MNVVAKKMIMHMIISLFVMLSSLVLVFLVFPLENWSDLWTKTLLDLPIAVMVVAVILTIGLVTGFISGINEWQRIKLLGSLLEDNINPGTEQIHSYPSEFETVFSKINELKQQYKEQMKMTQKLVNEKVEEQEKQVQEIISQERNRLARELHDSVSQQLFAASMLMSAINEQNEKESTQQSKHLRLVESMIHQSQLEMRALLLHLRPVALNGKSLKEGIRELLMELKQKVPIDIEWKAEDMKLERGIEDHLFRILQESVSNTLRHAKANKLEVLLIERDQVIILRITDDGVGFQIDEENKTGSYGLQNMKERAAEIGGTLKLVSLPGKGTRLEVKVPILDEQLPMKEVDEHE